MKKRRIKAIICIIAVLGITLIIKGIYETTYNGKISIGYGNVKDAYESSAHFEEKDGKAYPIYRYTNKNTKKVLMKNVKMKVFSQDKDELIIAEEIPSTIEVAPNETKVFKFKSLNKTIEEVKDYYVTVEIE